MKNPRPIVALFGVCVLTIVGVSSAQSASFVPLPSIQGSSTSSFASFSSSSSAASYGSVYKRAVTPYVSRRASNARGHDTTRITTAVSFQAKALRIPGSGALLTSTGADMPLWPLERQYICSIQKIIPADSTDSLKDSVARQMAGLMQRSVDMVRRSLKSTTLCKPAVVVVAPKAKAIVIRLSASGVVLSTNAVWNVCISGQPLTLEILRQNKDQQSYRRGHTKIDQPLTCSNYRVKGNEWKHPDFPGLVLTLDKTGHPIGKMPTGYMTVRDKPPVTSSGSTVKSTK